MNRLKELSYQLRVNIRTEVKVAQLADDTILFAMNEESVKQGLKIIQEFGDVSGMKLNKLKTQGMRIGKNRSSMYKNNSEINWVTDLVKILGVYVGYDKALCEQRKWNDNILKLEHCLNIWQRRNLTIFGRSIIVKTLGLSKLIYNASIIEVPDWVVKIVNNLIYRFHMESEKTKNQEGYNDRTIS